MRRLTILATAVMALLVGAGLAPVAAVGTGSMSGTVTDAGGVGLSGVTVQVTSYDDSNNYAVQSTGAGGAFSFTGLTPGDYYVCFITTPTTAGGSSSTGYVNVCWQDVQIPFGISPSDLTHVTVADGANTGGIVQVMPAGGAITGTVTDDAGNPIAGAAVTASAPSSYPPSGHAVSDAQGKYTIDALYAGTYYVCTSTEGATGGPSTTGHLDGCLGGGLAQGYPGNVRPYGEDPTYAVTATSGVMTPVSDLKLKDAGQIRGTLTNAQGAPIPGVRVYGWGDGNMTVTATDTTDANGQYLLSVDNPDGSANNIYHGTRLPLDEFRVFFSPANDDYVRAYYPHVPSPGNQAWGQVPRITPTAGTPTVLDDTLEAGGSLGGKVTDSSGNPLQGVNVAVKHDELWIDDVYTAANGTYSLGGLPAADYTVCFGAEGATGGSSQAGYLDACSAGSPTNAPQTVTLSTAQHRTDVGGALPSASAIGGTIVNESGQNVSNVMVTVEQDGLEVTRTWSSWNGNYRSQRLPAGSYTICFTPPAWSPVTYLKECWANQPEGADPTPIVTTAGAVSTANVTLAEAPPPPDTTAPVVTLETPAALLSVNRTVRATFSATDVDTAVANYDVRYRVASWKDSGFGAYQLPGSWQQRTGNSVSLTGTPGRTYCFSVRARDVEGNVSAWTGEKCRAVPLDDRSLAAATPGWSRLASNRAYLGTVTRSDTLNATLRLTGARAAHLALVVTTCKTCGKVGVYVDGRRLATINTYSATTKRQVLKFVPAFTLRTATITLKVLLKKPVIIDGLLVTRK